MKRLPAITLVMALLAPGTASADRVLSLTDVLRAAVTTHPKLASARAYVSDQRGRLFAAESAFEPTLSAVGQALPAGYYEYWQLATTIEQTIPATGARVAAGYRMGRGDIPPYYGERATRDGGELYVSAKLPLLADRTIDSDRANIRKARIGVKREKAALARGWLEVGRDASLSYWEWVAAGQRLRVANELGVIAEKRALQIGQQVSSGARPRIDGTDARRVLLARQSSIVEAQAAFAKAQQKLSLFYRDGQLRPISAGLDRVPAAIAEAPRILSRDGQRWIDEAIRNRPELEIIKLEQHGTRIDREQADNLSLPRVDLMGFVARDLGDGRPSLGQTDVGIGLTISVPLLRRKGRGLRQSAEAKLAALEAERRGLKDRIQAEIRQHIQLAGAAQQRASLASERLDAVRTLAEAERERLRQGASNVLTVNLRELDVASTAVEVIDAELDGHRAAINLRFARGVPLSP